MRRTMLLLIFLFLTITQIVGAQKDQHGRKKYESKHTRTRNHYKHIIHHATHGNSPPVTGNTKAMLTINSFEKGGDGGGPSECDGKYHSNNTPIVALSTGWYAKGKRCHHYITIHGNGRTVKAKVVDECDSHRGCRNNIVDASKAVWKALGVRKKDWGLMKVTWSD